MQRHIENTFYDLMGVKLSGDATEEELASLELLLNDYPELAVLHHNIVQHSLQPAYSDELLQQAYASHYIKKKLLPGLQQPAPKAAVLSAQRKRMLFYAVAAACIGILFMAYYFFSAMQKNSSGPGTVYQNEMATTKGSKSNVKLPDGTVVFLNADSRITYEPDFNRSTREITLTGEAFFDVKHDAQKPFIIHTGKADIKVLGTAFNVRNYPQEDLLETSLIRGKIEVLLHDPFSNKFVLKPADKLVISKSKIAAQRSSIEKLTPENVVELTHINYKDSAITELCWMQNKAAFTNKTLEEIATELERQFDITVIFKNEAVKKYRYTVYTENYNLNEIMQVLQLSRRFDYDITANKKLIIE